MESEAETVDRTGDNDHISGKTDPFDPGRTPCRFKITDMITAGPMIIVLNPAFSQREMIRLFIL